MTSRLEPRVSIERVLARQGPTWSRRVLTDALVRVTLDYAAAVAAWRTAAERARRHAQVLHGDTPELAAERRAELLRKDTR